MEQETRDYIHTLLLKIKELAFENMTLQSVIDSYPNPEFRQYCHNLSKALLESPAHRGAFDATFDPHIERIMRTIENLEGLVTLLKSPTKGLPN